MLFSFRLCFNVPSLISDFSYLCFSLFLPQKFLNSVDILKESPLGCVDSIFLFSVLFIFVLMFIIYFFVFVLGLEQFSFSVVKLGYWFQIFPLTVTSFPLGTAFTASGKFWDVLFLFSVVWRHFLIFFVIYSLTHWLFKSMWFYFYIFVNFPVFPLLLISSFIPLWLGKRLCI